MDINAEIASVKAELVELKAQLKATTDKEERVAFLWLIEAKEIQLTEFFRMLNKEGKNFLISLSFNLLIHSSVSMSWLTSRNRGCR